MRAKLKWIAVYLCVLLPSMPAWCQPGVLNALDLAQGHWEMAAVRLHNYKQLPLQEELGTFLVQDPQVLAQMQVAWKQQPFYEDYCDYHYALKFYRDRQLVKTLLLNLDCGYITDGQLNYRFAPEQLVRFRAHFVRVPWSHIRFTDLKLMRKAIDKIAAQPNYYFYSETTPYHYDGCFVLKTTRHTWDEKLDSIQDVLRAHIAHYAGRNDFYIQSKLLFADDAGRISYRHDVYCNKGLAARYLAQDERNLVCGWQSHFELVGEAQPSLGLVVVGINEAGYKQLMRP